MNGYFQESAKDSESIQEIIASGPGEYLKKRRESMGLTHADVAAHLNLRISIIEAIEENNYKHMPKLVFARGYLRSYAKLLGLSGNEIIAAFNKLEYPENPSELPASPLRAGQKKPIKKEHSLIPWIALVILIVIFALVGFWKPITSFLTLSQSSSETTTSQVIQEKPSTPAPASVQHEQKQETSIEESSAALPDLDQFKQEN
jgi:cytoskeleton protein RodZ